MWPAADGLATGLGLLVAVLAAAAFVTPSPAAADETRVITYSIATRGDVGSDRTAFEQVVREAYADPRGWSLGGLVRFARVAGNGDFVLWLASPDAMATFSSDCSPRWSCRVGRDVVINDARFRSGSPYWGGPLDDYRILLVNHETGHWLGFDHQPCSLAGAQAPVMMQQSKGVGVCVGNPWPLDVERTAAAKALGVAITPALPHARGFTPLP